MTRFSLVPLSLRRRFVIESLLAQDDESDLYLARPRNNGTGPLTLRVYQPGRWLDEPLLDRLTGQPVAGLLGYGRAGSGAGDLPWLTQVHQPAGSLRGLMTGEPWTEERAKEVVAAVADLAAAWRAATDRDLGDFRPEDLTVSGFEPLTLSVGLIPRPARYGWSRPPAPESQAGENGDPATWWALGVVVHELLTGRPPEFTPGEPAVELGEAGPGRWRPLLAGLLTVDPQARWTGREVAAWLAGGTPAVTPDRVPEPIRFEGREHRTPAALVAHMTAHPADTERWLLEGGDVLLANWLDLDVGDRKLDRALLEEPPPLVLTGLAATFTPGLRPRYRGFAVDADGLRELASGDTTGHLVLAEVLTSGALAHVARHPCGHQACAGADCREVARVRDELPIILAQARDVLDQMRERTGEIVAREWNRGVAVAVETTLDPGAIRRHRRRLRLEGLSSLGKGGPAWVDWWREQRRYALDGRTDELATRAALMVVVLLTAGAEVAGRQLAEENRRELARRRDEAADQGRAALARAQEGALTLLGEIRRRGPVVLRKIAITLLELAEKAAAQIRAFRARNRTRVKS
ncbi:hypothetical protein [Acrocarpospora catenulata]|uniref:hypothetical protein n=1 Tax=Acrocarpospora catenulata TaxID=2836182 RepID=UPI001BDA1F4D|nr:hypothetical protein [Acrocarpospora catenulata]